MQTPEYSATHINSATTTAVKASYGILHQITINKAGAGTITVNNGAGAIAVFASGAAVGPYPYDAVMPGKIEVVTGAGFDGDLTVLYQ